MSRLSPNASQGAKNLVWLSVVVLLAALMLSKLWVIHAFGNNTPYWDQWCAEAQGLYKPWMEGRFSAVDLVKAHNEHRIMTTRIVHLGLFETLGQRWSPVAQMCLNAVLHTSAILGLGLFAFLALHGLSRAVFMLFCAFWFSAPFGWENILAGFQTQFYLLLLLSVIFLFLCCCGKLDANKQAAVGFLSLLLVFTLASGALTVLAGFAVLAIRRLFFHEKIISIPLLFVLLAVGLIAIGLTPTIEVHGALKAQNPLHFVAAIGKAFAWPLQPETLGIRDTLLPLLMQLPLLIAVPVAYLVREKSRQPFYFFLSMALWLGLQAAALAYGRGTAGLSSRYLDILAIGVAANCAALLFLWGNAKSFPRVAIGTLAVFWLAGLASGTSEWFPRLRMELKQKATASRLQEQNVRRYLLTGEPAWLHNAEFHEIPYPSGAALQQFLDDKTIRSFLPQELFEPWKDKVAR
jgi:hypothetical protein